MATYRDEQLAKAAKVDHLLHAAMTRLSFNQPDTCIRNMIKALEMCPRLNTPADAQRLADAKYYLANRHKLNRVLA